MDEDEDDEEEVSIGSGARGTQSGIRFWEVEKETVCGVGGAGSTLELWGYVCVLGLRHWVSQPVEGAQGVLEGPRKVWEGRKETGWF